MNATHTPSKPANADTVLKQITPLAFAQVVSEDQDFGEIFGGYRIRCPHPDHEDHRASCDLITVDGIAVWRCWGCNCNGNALNWLRLYETRLSPQQEAERLCEIFSVDPAASTQTAKDRGIFGVPAVAKNLLRRLRKPRPVAA